MTSATPWISIEARRRLAHVRSVIDSGDCGVCKASCGHPLNGPGCEHYACLGADAAVADTCPAIPRDR